MKKMLFSAIAMIAFTVTASAATEVIESVEVVATSSTPCADAWSVDYNYYRVIGWSPAEAERRANENFDKCLDTLYPLVDEPKDSPTTDPGTKAPVGIFR